MCSLPVVISYDYDWKSNRWASGIVSHVVDIIALSDDSLGNKETGIPHTITILTTATSPSFVIASTKKSTTGTATNSGPMVGEKRKQQPSVGINVGPSPSQPTFKEIQCMSQFPAAMVGGAIAGGCIIGGGRGVWYILCTNDCVVLFLSLLSNQITSRLLIFLCFFLFCLYVYFVLQISWHRCDTIHWSYLEVIPTTPNPPSLPSLVMTIKKCRKTSSN